MDWYSLAVFFHVLLFVFWLGTDVGVFLAAKISERAELSVETRSTVLGLGMVLDRLPRSALALIVPSGLGLATASGQLVVPHGLLIGAWLLALAWLAILWAGFLNPQTKTEQRAMLFNFAMNVVLAFAVLGAGVFLLLDGTSGWLALKVLIVGFVFACGVTLDVLFKPAVEAFVKITMSGATDELNRTYSRAIGPVYIVVLVIYAAVLAAAWLGIAKPAF
ncbi:MAG: hypothetical protein AAFX56_15295 [Pseudomonadota bacterium]